MCLSPCKPMVKSEIWPGLWPFTTPVVLIGHALFLRAQEHSLCLHRHLLCSVGPSFYWIFIILLDYIKIQKSHEWKCNKSKPDEQNLIQREWFFEPLEHIQVSSSGSHWRFWCVGFDVVSFVFESRLSVSIVSVTSVPSPLGPSVSDSSQGSCSASHLHLFSSKYAKSVLSYILKENYLGNDMFQLS